MTEKSLRRTSKMGGGTSCNLKMANSLPKELDQALENGEANPVNELFLPLTHVPVGPAHKPL